MSLHSAVTVTSHSLCCPSTPSTCFYGSLRLILGFTCSIVVMLPFVQVRMLLWLRQTGKYASSGDGESDVK